MLPLFKSHYSIGKSILTLDPSETGPGPSSIISIALDNNLKEIVLVEDSPIGFLESLKVCEENNIQLIFGLRFNFCESSTTEEKTTDSHKVIIFSKNKNGCSLLNSIYTESFTQNGGFLNRVVLKSLWSSKDLKLCIPFYDSFIYKNLFSFSGFVPDLDFASPTFFLEKNGLPVDDCLRKGVLSYAKSSNLSTAEVQSIYYKNKSDSSAFMAYKLICSRKNFAGRATSLEMPNLDHMGSDEFCWESYLEKTHEQETITKD